MELNVKRNNPSIVFWVFAAVVAVLLLLQAFSENVSDNTLDSGYQKLPEHYVALVENTQPISPERDVPQPEHLKNKPQKVRFDTYLTHSHYSRELFLIAPKDSIRVPKKTIVVHARLFDQNEKVVPVKATTRIFAYLGNDYLVAQFSLPNIDLKKVVFNCYDWEQKLIEVDNAFMAKELKTLDGHKAKQRALNLEKTPYDYLMEKSLDRFGIVYRTDEAKPKVKYQDADRLTIENEIDFWKKLTQNKDKNVAWSQEKFAPFQSDLEAYQKGAKKFSQVFDTKKLANYYALLNLYSRPESGSLHLYKNEKKGLLEPYYDKKPLGETNNYVKDLNLYDSEFLAQYAIAIQSLVDEAYPTKIIKAHGNELKRLLTNINATDPNILLDENLLWHNRLILAKTIHPSTRCSVVLQKHSDQLFELAIENTTNFGLQIVNLSLDQKRTVALPGHPVLLLPGERQKVTFYLTEGFGNLFVHKSKKETGFIFEKDIFKIQMGYTLGGINELHYQAIVPFKELEAMVNDNDIFRIAPVLDENYLLAVNENDRILRLKEEDVLDLSQPLMIPSGYTFELSPGQEIHINDGGKIISGSPLLFNGTAEQPIRIYSKNGNGQGLMVYSAKKASELTHVHFSGLSNPQHGLWDVSGAVTFYESPVHLNHVTISDNSCEDALNIVRTHFTMKNSHIAHTQSDAFDGDFVTGSLTNCTFTDLGNDAVDVSGSNISLTDVKITNAGDKGISSGEDSIIAGKALEINSSEIAVACKDLSKVLIEDIIVTDSKLVFTAFQKKPEFGPSEIQVNQIETHNIITHDLIEHRSTLLIDGKKYETTSGVKAKMYGVEYGVDSKETRVKK